MRHLQQEGLKLSYTNDSNIKSWVRRIMAMSLLSTSAVPLAWGILQFPPPTENPVDAARLSQFAAYVERTWISGSFPASLWTHYDNDGPRTTNVAEGWHSGLNTTFGISNPSMRMFLDWLQKCQHEVSCRSIQLAAGRPPKQRKAAYIRVDNQIRKKKLHFAIDFGRVFAYVFPNPSSSLSVQQIIENYLDDVAYLVMGGDGDSAADSEFFFLLCSSEIDLVCLCIKTTNYN
jgi:hypothetical protein